jgi:hypothetical protein
MAASAHYPQREESLGAAPLRFSRVRVFVPASRFVSSIDPDQPRSAPKRAMHEKNRTLENRKGAAPATHNQITFQIFYPNSLSERHWS